MMAEKISKFTSNDARFLINSYGFSIFPVWGMDENMNCMCGDINCTNQGKHPATPNGCSDATNDINKLLGLWAGRKGLNVGIATGKVSNCFVVDIDGHQAEKDLQYLIDIHGELPQTLQQTTGRGRHLFFKYPKGVDKIKTRRGVIGEKIDIRGDGGYVVGYKSTHKTGATYDFVNPLEDIEDAPQWLIDIVLADNHKEKTSNVLPLYQHKTTGIFSNNSDWSKEQIQDLLTYISPDCGYDEWYQIGMAIKDYGLPFEVWDNWSKGSAKYVGHEMAGKWNSFKGSGVSIGTLVYHAKQGGWKPNYRNTFNQTIEKSSAVEIVNPKTGEITTEESLALNIKATSIHDIDLDNIPPREFLYGDIVARKYVSMIIAPAGVGKSIFSMQLAISAASGKPWASWSSKQQNLNVWVYNNEEGNDELIRRLKAIMIENELSKSDFKGNFYIDSGEKQSITIAKVDRDGESVIATPDYDSLVAEIKERKIDILIIDPFAETHAVSENSNDKIKIVTGLYRKIAFDANCAVLLIHHARKGVENLAGNAEAGRGGGAQIGVVRRAFTLAKMSKEEADDIGVPPEKRHWYVRLDDAKSNITAPAENTTWFKFKSVSIGNGNVIYPDGDSVGILKHTTIDCIKADNGNVISAEEDRILQCIIEYSEKEGGKNFPFNDARKYIQDYSNINFGRDKLTQLMKSAMDKNSITEYMGGKFKPSYLPNTSENNKLFIFINEQ